MKVKVECFNYGGNQKVEVTLTSSKDKTKELKLQSYYWKDVQIGEAFVKELADDPVLDEPTEISKV